jgi:hypothetical protein
MMMLVGSALPVNSFAVLAPYDIDLASFGHGLKVSVDGCEADSISALAKLAVKLLRTYERRQVIHD